MSQPVNIGAFLLPNTGQVYLCYFASSVCSETCLAVSTANTAGYV